jgi:hypothetical protein
MMRLLPSSLVARGGPGDGGHGGHGGGGGGHGGHGGGGRGHGGGDGGHGGGGHGGGHTRDECRCYPPALIEVCIEGLLDICI